MKVLIPRILAVSSPLFLYRGDILEPFASAVLARFGDDHFLLTAAHVLDNFLDYDLYFGSGQKVKFLEGSPICTLPPTGRGRKEDKFDLGIVHLSRETVKDMEEGDFLILSDLDILDTPTPSRFYMFAGYPATRNKRSIGEEVKAVLYTFLASPGTLKDYQSADLDPTSSLLLRFNKKKLWCPSGPVTGPDIFGVSGGGVWALCCRPGVMEPDARLVAIAIEWWHRQQKYVLATKIHIILAVIWNRFPRLRSVLPKPPRSGDRA